MGVSLEEVSLGGVSFWGVRLGITEMAMRLIEDWPRRW